MRKNLICLSTICAAFVLMPQSQVGAMQDSNSEMNNIVGITRSIISSYENFNKFEFQKGKIDYLTNSINPTLKHQKVRNIIGGKGSLLFTDDGEMLDLFMPFMEPRTIIKVRRLCNSRLFILRTIES